MVLVESIQIVALLQHIIVLVVFFKSNIEKMIKQIFGHIVKLK